MKEQKVSRGMKEQKVSSERDRVDAERYRWLRNGNRRFDGARSNDGYLYGDELDAMIDTAMKEGGK